MEEGYFALQACLSADGKGVNCQHQAFGGPGQILPLLLGRGVGNKRLGFLLEANNMFRENPNIKFYIMTSQKKITERSV